jgi:Fe(3+) dicitrate transport protein
MTHLTTKPGYYHLMMKLKDFKFILLLFLTSYSLAQTTIQGVVTDTSNSPVAGVALYTKDGRLLTQTDENGLFSIVAQEDSIEVLFYYFEFATLEYSFSSPFLEEYRIVLQPINEQLTEVEINARKAKTFELQRLKDVEGTAIYAGKKTEVVLVDQSSANLATNNARQIFAQVAGLNIYQNDDAGLQLNIGGRGLDPNRTSNFNTRQNGYDISADVLGYPESYYAPPAEAIEQIEIIRGAASLQYGTQFGGLVNFKLKKPPADKKVQGVLRNTLGNNGLYTNFTSVGGTIGKLSYYTYFNYKEGDGFRPNSGFNSRNVYTYLGYQISEKTSISGEFTYLNYLAQQGGGLTDAMFRDDPYQSNRARNWFQVDWLLWNFKLEHEFNKTTRFSLNLFGLDASRDALGFRTNRVSQVDDGSERDLIAGTFSNYGLEARFLSEYELADKKSVFLIGTKFYNAQNTTQQGPGSAGSDPDFSFQTDDFPDYPFQNAYDNPNLNVSLFGENIIYLNDKLSLTPGFRLEYIKTESEGFLERINTDAAGNVIFRGRVEEDLVNERSFVLLGLGASYKWKTGIEFYANTSQNYRSVTFADINTFNPAFAIDPNISDESGLTADFGMRGTYKKVISYDINVFSLFYNDRIGFTQQEIDGRVKSVRGNVGDAVIYGLESLIDFNLEELFIKDNRFVSNFFINTSIINSEYLRSDAPGISGNKVEFVPNLNFKSGLKIGYNNFLANFQYTLLTDQFSDATNAVDGGLSGVLGEIPSYQVVDFSTSYTFKNFRIETGINNLLDEAYFTRRATGYPGPGIIPSPDRNYYMTLQIKI